MEGEFSIVLVAMLRFLLLVLGKIFAHTVDEPACMKTGLYHTYKHEPTLGHYHIVGVPIIEVYVYA
jgi:hypothetical protein